MKKRCLCPNHDAYHNYGGRGVKICSFLCESPFSIIQTIGDRPKGKTLDRIDNNGNYSCGDCDECVQNGWTMNLRWSTARDQARNARFNRLVTIDGITKPAIEWAEIFGLKSTVFYMRLNAGHTGINLTGPLRRINRKL